MKIRQKYCLIRSYLTLNLNFKSDMSADISNNWKTQIVEET